MDGAEASPCSFGCIVPPRGCGRVALLDRGGIGGIGKLVCCLLISAGPGSGLFPSTTLFRSSGFGSGSGLGGIAAVPSTGLGEMVGAGRRGKRSGGGNT